MRVKKLWCGGGQDYENEKDGFVMFIRSGSDHIANESNDQKNHEYYKHIFSYLLLQVCKNNTPRVPVIKTLPSLLHTLG